MRPRRVTFVALAGVALVLAVGVFMAVALTRRIPDVALVLRPLPHAFPRRATGLVWPGSGQAALAVPEVGLLRSSHAQQPEPIASAAKLMTALVVLDDHPLQREEAGSEISVTPYDVALYRAERKLGQSTVAVRPGEELSEREALEGLLLPSANNLATLLADWDAGTEAGFVEKMNARAAALGMRHTHYADASGFSSATVSTALDQVRLAASALGDPALVQISSLREASLPVAGTVRNLDALLGSEGVVAGKTGTTGAAGGCFVFAARIPHGRRMLRVVGAVLGQPGSGEFEQLDAAFRATRALLRSARRQVMDLSDALRGRVFGTLRSSWARPVRIRARSIPHLPGWSGLPLRIRVRAPGHLRSPVRAGQVVGVALIRAGPQRASVRLVARRPLPAPSLSWRLSHP
jgi:D-alanyl-D-alanine carboxypeptidase (penicillin-binding protein 5/6)